MYARTLVFCTVITTVQSLPFLWILIQTVFVGIDLQEVGPPDFLIYAFYSLFVCFYEFSFILAYGSEANAMDTKIKEYLLNFTQECSDSRHLALEKSVFERNGVTYIMVRQPDKTWLCFNNNVVYTSLYGFVDKNDELL